MEVGEIPVELTVSPKQPMVVSGLDIHNNNIHRSVYDALTLNRKADRLPLSFRLIGTEDEFPNVSQKRSEYDSYIPGGIIKRKWMRKHLNDVPAVVALFLDLDWSDPVWVEKKTAAQSKIQSLRHSLQGRNTRLAMVLIQSTASLPTGDDVVAADRATELCLACDLSPKALFVLPRTDHLYGYIIRLEHAFYELGQAYYQAEIRRVKVKKESLNRATHQFLLVRSQFKLGFFTQLRQESHTALRHYKLAYQHLLELDSQLPEDRWLEWKTVAGFLNYKVCSLCFQHNTPLDSISQFRRHTEYFRGKVGNPREVAEFQHAAWLSKEFSSFAQLFESAVTNGLAAIQTQHPGFYFQSAAQQAMARKTAVQKLWRTLSGVEYPNIGGVDPLEIGESGLEFYGQWPWRVGLTAGETKADQNVEEAGYLALKLREIQKDLSGPILQLLSAAMTQFKKYRSPRTRRFIMVQMGEEYLGLGEYAKALKLFSHAIWEYRQEKWWRLLRGILLQALQCVFCLANVKEYMTISLQLLSPLMRLAEEERCRIQGNLLRLLAGNVPEAEPGLPAHSVANGVEVWNRELADRCFFLVQMEQISGAIQAKAWFINSEVEADKRITVRVALNLQCPYPMTLSKLAVKFNHSEPDYEAKCTVEGSSDLHLTPGHLKLYEFAFLPLKKHVGTNLEISSVLLNVGTLQCGVYGTFQWEVLGLGGSGGEGAGGVSHEYVLSSKAVSLFQASQTINSLKIVSRKALVDLSVEGGCHALLDEKYPISFKIQNMETERIQNLNVEVRVVKNWTEGDDQPLVFLDYSGTEVDHLDLDIPDIGINSLGEANIVVIAKDLRDFNLVFDVKYEMKVKTGEKEFMCCCEKTHSSPLSTGSAFTLNSRLLSSRMEHLDKLYTGEQGLILTELKVCSTVNLTLETISWELCPQFELTQPGTTLDPVNLKPGETCSLLASVLPLTSSDTSILVGEIVVSWRRPGSTSGCVRSKLPLPYSVVEDSPLLVDVGLGAYGGVRASLPLLFSLHNTLPHILTLTLTLDPAEAFMFSGHKQIQVRLLPREARKVSFILFPLVAGMVALPKVRLSSPAFPQEVMDRVIERSVPNSIFILPYGKSAKQVS